jgi:type IV pilus assembly protein PilC
VIWLSEFFQRNILYLMGGLALIIFLARWFYRSDWGRNIWDRTLLWTPLFGPVVRKSAVARFTRTLGTMMASGVPLLDALDIVAKAAGNRKIEQSIYYVREKISEGQNMVGPLEDTKVFPPMVVQMIGVGEATGALDVMLTKIADFYEEEVDDAVSAMTTAMEPFMLLMVAVVLGGMLIAMYMPIFSLAGNIK